MTHYTVQISSISRASYNSSLKKNVFKERLKAGVERINWVLLAAGAGSMLEVHRRRTPSRRISDGSWGRHIFAVSTGMGDRSPKPRRSTQPGHPSVDRHNEYWRWSRSLLGKKRRFLRNSGPVPGLLAYWHSWLKALVAMGPAIRPTCVVC